MNLKAIMIKPIILTFLLFLFISCRKDDPKQSNKDIDLIEAKQPIQSIKAELLYKTDALLGEGAIWNADNQKLYWVDINANKAHIYNPATKTNKTFEAPSQVGTIVPVDETEAMLALRDGIYVLNTDNGNIDPYMLVDHNEKNVRFNDGKADPSGRLWVGTLDLDFAKPIGRLYMFDKIGNIVEQELAVTISNGITWNKAKDKMYYIDTPTQIIASFDYDNATGKISNQNIVASIDKKFGSPDGMTIDENGNLWVGMWNGNAVLCFDSVTGEILHKIDVPAHNVTSCAFGGEDLNTLYITTSSEDMTIQERNKYPDAGSLFVAYPNVKGVKAQHFIKE